MSEVYILSGARTPFATWKKGTTGAGAPGGALSGVDAYDLGAAAAREAMKRAAVDPSQIDHVVFANTYYPDHYGCYLARYVGLRAGVPENIPGFTVNLACSAGLYSIGRAADDISRGEATLAIAGGTENISGVNRSLFIPSFNDHSCGMQISMAVELLGNEYGINRELSDAWALRSHARALKAEKSGRFAEEIIAVGPLAKDDHILSGPSIDFFRGAEALNGEGSGVTKGNSHGVVDGASALILASEDFVRTWKGRPLGRYVASAFAGVDPKKMSYASVVAMEKVLKKAGWKIQDVDLFEINETFAAQVLVDIKALGIDEEKVNVNGGAIALGHPFGASGGRLVMTLLLELAKRGLKRGAAAISAGAGLGAALLVEAR